MTVGANDANGAQSSLHTLKSGGMLVTEDTYDGASDGPLLIFHHKCAVCESLVRWHWLKYCTKLPNCHLSLSYHQTTWSFGSLDSCWANVSWGSLEGHIFVITVN